MPVAHFAVEQGHGQRAEALGDFFRRHPRLELGGEPRELRLALADLRHDRLELRAHELGALRRELFPLTRPGPAGGQGLVLEFEAQRAPVVFQPAQFALEKLALPPRLAPLLLGRRPGCGWA